MPVSVLTWHSKRRSQRSSSREQHIGDVVESWRVFSNGDSFLIVMRNENGTPIQLVGIRGTKISAEQHFQAPRLPNRKLPCSRYLCGDRSRDYSPKSRPAFANRRIALS